MSGSVSNTYNIMLQIKVSLWIDDVIICVVNLRRFCMDNRRPLIIRNLLSLYLKCINANFLLSISFLLLTVFLSLNIHGPCDSWI